LPIFPKNLKIPKKTLDKGNFILYNKDTMIHQMNIMEKQNRAFTIPPAAVQEAEELFHRTHIPFRDCLEMVVRSQKLEVTSPEIDSED